MQEKKNVKKVLALDLHTTPYTTALDKIVELGRRHIPSYVCFANVHMTIEAQYDRTFSKQVNTANLVLADGMPLVAAVKWLYGERCERVAGMDVMPDLIDRAAREQLKIFFFGTTPSMLEAIQKKIKSEYSESIIAGMISPPFNTSLDDPSYVDAINMAGANLVFVALGCPKQEKWMASHSPNINAVLLGVGGAFPVYAGTAKRAPVFLRNNGLEWLYRLYQEPRRLFRRYFVTNSLFIWLLTKEKIFGIFNQKTN